MTAILPASAWRHQRATAVETKGDPERKGRFRVVLAMLGFGILYGVLATRLVLLGVAPRDLDDDSASFARPASQARPDIVDRNGETLATDIRTAALFAEPRYVIDPDEATEMIASVLPDLDRGRLRQILSSNAKFAYIKREITPRQQQAIHQLGIPGIGFRVENRRFYPGGAAASHVLGSVNIDNHGIAGMEKYIDSAFLNDLQDAGFGASASGTGSALEPVKLSLDLRVQHVVRDELVQSMGRYKAIAAIGIVLDVNTGEVIAMSSVPDYDANNRDEALDRDKMNRATVGVFEMGSTFKGFTTAMALDSGAVRITDSFDATHGLSVGKFTISDFHGKHRWLTVPGDLHLFLQYRRGARGAGRRHAGPARLPETLRAARHAEDGAAGSRRADRSEDAVGQGYDHHNGLRTRNIGLANADRRSGRSADKWGLSHQSDVSAAHGGRGGSARAPDPEAGDEPCAPADLPPERHEGIGKAGRCSGLQRRRKDRDSREGGRRTLLGKQAPQCLFGRISDGRAQISRARGIGRTEAGEARRECRRRRERRPHGRPYHSADRTDARHGAEAIGTGRPDCDGARLCAMR
jgi:hypothetical protein